MSKLNQNVLECQLLACCSVYMSLVTILHALESVVETVFFIVFEVSLGDLVGTSQVDLGCRKSVLAILFKSVFAGCEVK